MTSKCKMTRSTEALGGGAAELDAVAREALREVLSIRVADEKVDALQVALDHAATGEETEKRRREQPTVLDASLSNQGREEILLLLLGGRGLLLVYGIASRPSDAND